MPTVPSECDLVIDGYPRSGNTFAKAMFLLTQGERWGLLTHRHNPCSVAVAIKMGKPVLFIIRQPVDSIISWHLFTGQPLERIIAHYVVFHRKLLIYRDKMAIVTFDELTNDFPDVLRRLQKRAALDFNTAFEHDTLARQAIASIDDTTSFKDGADREKMIPRPSEWRRELKTKLAVELRTQCYAQAMADADRVYAQFSSGREKEPASHMR
jgi:hypothetical protein